MAERRQATLPRVIFINRMDRENANFQQALEQLQARYGKQIAPLELPIGSQDSFSGVVNLIDRNAYIGEKGTPGEVPAEMAAAVDAAREQLIEAVCEADDDVMAKYLDGDELSREELTRGAAEGDRPAASPTRCSAGSAAKNIGVAPLPRRARRRLPVARRCRAAHRHQTRPARTPLKADASGPLAALVFKTAADPFVGKLTYLRVLSGTLQRGLARLECEPATRTSASGSSSCCAARRRTTSPPLAAGDIGAVAKLAHTVTGDTLCTREHQLTLPPIEFPRPPFNVAVTPKGKADVDKLGPVAAAHRRRGPDARRPSRRRAPARRSSPAWAKTHVEVAAEKMKRKFGVEVDLHAPRVPYRETVTGSVDSEYIHKKQTGGHGQYARVAIKVEPNKGGGFEFVDKVVGGAVPRNYIPAVEKGVQEALHEGALAHFPMVDVRVTLFDGKEHPSTHRRWRSSSPARRRLSRAR